MFSVERLLQTRTGRKRRGGEREGGEVGRGTESIDKVRLLIFQKENAFYILKRNIDTWFNTPLFLPLSLLSHRMFCSAGPVFS